MYRINLSKFDDFISGNNAGVISRASSIKRNSCVLSGRRPAGGGRAVAKRAGGGGKMYKYDEKSRQGKAGFGYYISAESERRGGRVGLLQRRRAHTHAHEHRHEKKRNISATKPIILQARKFVSLFFMMPLKYINT